MRLVTIQDQVMARYGQRLQALADGQGRMVLARALVHTGRKARTQVVRALTAQTGLKRQVLARAVREQRGRGGDLAFILESRGGNVSLKYFKPRETRRGVSAAPWNARKVFSLTFNRSGWTWATRRASPKLNGHVFKRQGAARLPIAKVKSALYIPDEMVSGATVDAWEQVIGRDLAGRVGHELARVLG